MRPLVNQAQPILADLFGPLQYVIIDVGYVLDIAHGMPAIFQVSDEDVDRKIGESMAQMCGVIRRNTACVHRYGVAFRLERLDLPRKVVVELQVFTSCKRVHRGAMRFGGCEHQTVN
jgi:hypothetical protein